MIRTAAIFVVLGCSSSKTEEPPKPYDELVARVTALMPALAELERDIAQDDCKHAMTALHAFGDAHRAELHAVVPLIAKLSSAEKTRYQYATSWKLHNIEFALQGLTYRCQDAPGIVDAIARAGFLPTAEAVP